VIHIKPCMFVFPVFFNINVRILISRNGFKQVYFKFYFKLKVFSRGFWWIKRYCTFVIKCFTGCVCVCVCVCVYVSYSKMDI